MKSRLGSRDVIDTLAELFKLLGINCAAKQRAFLVLVCTAMLVLLIPIGVDGVKATLMLVEREQERQEGIRQVEEQIKAREMVEIERGERAPDGEVIEPARRIAISIEAGEPIAIPEEEAKDAVSAFIKERDLRVSQGRLSPKSESSTPMLFFNFNDKATVKLSVGKVAFLMPPKISEINGPSSAYLWIQDKIVLAIGWSTNGKVDGETLFDDLIRGAIVSAIDNTRGGTKYVIQPFDLYEQLSALGEF
jgi:hypothetical protein